MPQRTESDWHPIDRLPQMVPANRNTSIRFRIRTPDGQVANRRGIRGTAQHIIRWMDGIGREFPEPRRINVCMPRDGQMRTFASHRPIHDSGRRFGDYVSAPNLKLFFEKEQDSMVVALGVVELLQRMNMDIDSFRVQSITISNDSKPKDTEPWIPLQRWSELDPGSKDIKIRLRLKTPDGGITEHEGFRSVADRIVRWTDSTNPTPILVGKRRIDVTHDFKRIVFADMGPYDENGKAFMVPLHAKYIDLHFEMQQNRQVFVEGILEFLKRVRMNPEDFQLQKMAKPAITTSLKKERI